MLWFFLIINTHTHTHTHTQAHTCTHAHMHASTHRQTDTHKHTYTCMHLYTHNMHTHVHTYAHTHTHTHMHTCTHTHTHRHTHIKCIHTETQTHTLSNYVQSCSLWLNHYKHLLWTCWCSIFLQNSTTGRSVSHLLVMQYSWRTAHLHSTVCWIQKFSVPRNSWLSQSRHESLYQSMTRTWGDMSNLAKCTHTLTTCLPPRRSNDVSGKVLFICQ